MGDRAWRRLLEQHNAMVRRELDRWDGREVNTAGDAFVAVFDGPAEAIQCAWGVREAVREMGLRRAQQHQQIGRAGCWEGVVLCV
jgi:class 3 adenylate cyclase